MIPISTDLIHAANDLGVRPAPAVNRYSESTVPEGFMTRELPDFVRRLSPTEIQTSIDAHGFTSQDRPTRARRLSIENSQVVRAEMANQRSDGLTAVAVRNSAHNQPLHAEPRSSGLLGLSFNLFAAAG